MLYITTKHGDVEWHIDHKLPKLRTDQVLEIQADAHELHAIKQLFGESIPMTKNAIVNWAGDIARTIYLNLKVNH